MKNIEEILKEFGLEIPDEKKEEFRKTFHENYKTEKEVSGLQVKLNNAEETNANWQKKYDEDIASRDTDLADLKKQLEDAGTDAKKLKTLQGQLDTLQADYNKAKTDYANQLSAQKREFAIREATNSLKFTSSSAKKAFTTDALGSSNLTVDENSKLFGFNEFVEKYKEEDASAFVVDEPTPEPTPTPTPTFSTGSVTPPSKQEDDWVAPKIL